MNNQDALIPQPQDPLPTTRPQGVMQRMVPSRSDKMALMASVGWMCIPGLAGVLLAIHAFGVYGWPLFVYLPFMMGCGSTLLYSAHKERTMRESLKVSTISVIALAMILFVAAIEGAICIALASPLGWAVASLGAVVGFKVQQRAWSGRRSTFGLLSAAVLFAPGLMGAESATLTQPQPREVTTVVMRPGSVDAVWREVTSDKKLPEPDGSSPMQLLFKIGVGYPVEVQWSGQGVGAKRSGRYSTGAFAQEVTAWEPNQRLAFKTITQPIPMHELTPWGHFDAPHLHGHFKVLRGELRFAAGGVDAQGKPQTRVEAMSVYTHSIWPANYWHVWSDSLMHQVHGRWLNGQ